MAFITRFVQNRHVTAVAKRAEGLNVTAGDAHSISYVSKNYTHES